MSELYRSDVLLKWIHHVSSTQNLNWNIISTSETLILLFVLALKDYHYHYPNTIEQFSLFLNLM